MSKIAIKAENLSKAYQLGSIGTGTISRDIERWWAKIRGKEDPFLKIGETNDRTTKSNSDIVWSLKDINFEIEQGDAVGIIGRNGAGKSTLLKILSKVTAPTAGRISGNGRIASLLEVGTGFHPELTGRENIHLNGAILGMRKREIDRKFDEIVDFSGVERYIDTPVKRYSSGMYVRLAFAVAAHLEPEILIVDEVLAVGDTEFQKKCLGKMKNVNEKDGRTVLFVSHNMAAVKQLCGKGIVLQNGILVFEGTQNEAVNFYQNSHQTGSSYAYGGLSGLTFGNEFFKLLKLNITTDKDVMLDIESGFNLNVQFNNKLVGKTLGLSLIIKNQDELILFELFDAFAAHQNAVEGDYEISFKLKGNLLNAGTYSVDLIVAENQKYVIWQQEKIIFFEIENTLKNSGNSLNRIPGIIRPEYEIIKRT